MSDGVMRHLTLHLVDEHDMVLAVFENERAV